MQIVMARLIMQFFKQRNFNALQHLAKQLKIPGEKMLRLAKRTVENKPAPIKPQSIADKVMAISKNPQASKNFTGNLGRQMDRNVTRHGGTLPKKTNKPGASIDNRATSYNDTTSAIRAKVPAIRRPNPQTGEFVEPYITTYKPMAGHKAILYDRDGSVIQTGLQGYRTKKEAIQEATEWARAEGLKFFT